MKTNSILACNGWIACVPLTAAVSSGVPTTIKLLPKGWVESLKGDFLVDDVAVNEIITRFFQRKVDVVVDYEHQTLPGEPAPAAGWITTLEVRSDGLWGHVTWTEKARSHLANREYRYLSPVVFVRNSDKRAIYLHSVALTNTPAIDGMQPIVASLIPGQIPSISPEQAKVIRLLGISGQEWFQANTAPRPWKHPDPQMAKVHSLLGITETEWYRYGGR